MSKRKHAQKSELYRLGLDDTQIAEILNITPQAVWSWRQRHNLPSVHEPVPMEHVLDPDECRIMQHSLNSVVMAWDRGEKDIFLVLKTIRQHGLAKGA